MLVRGTISSIAGLFCRALLAYLTLRMPEAHVRRARRRPKACSLREREKGGWKVEKGGG